MLLKLLKACENSIAALVLVWCGLIHDCRNLKITSSVTTWSGPFEDYVERWSDPRGPPKDYTGSRYFCSSISFAGYTSWISPSPTRQKGGPCRFRAATDLVDHPMYLNVRDRGNTPTVDSRKHGNSSEVSPRVHALWGGPSGLKKFSFSAVGGCRICRISFRRSALLG